MAQVQILMENKRIASSQALQSLYMKPSGALLSRALCTGASRRRWRFCIAVVWQLLAQGGWAGPPGPGCSPMQEAGTGRGGGAWPPICSVGHSHGAERFTCNVQPCKRPCQGVNLTFGHSSAWAGVAQSGLGGPSCLPPSLTTRITWLNTWKGHLCLPPAQSRMGAFTWSVQPRARCIAAQLEMTFVERYGK